MRVFIAGATGVVGRPLVRELIRAGHDVTGMTRSPDKAPALSAEGAHPVVCDALDRDAVARAIAASAPDVVVHQLTALPEKYNPRRVRRLYRATDRLHIEGTDNLLAAAHEIGVGRFVAQSIAFDYERAGGRVKTETDPLDPAPPKAFRDAMAAMAHLERVTLDAEGVHGAVLRYGMFYGPGTWYSPGGHFANEVRRRRYPIVGDGRGVFSFVHVADAASATRLAIESGATGIFNVVDDEPAELQEWVPVFAAAVGAPKPWRAPVWLARLAAGSGAVEQLLSMRGADNAKAKAVLGWTLRFPTWRSGFAAQLGEPPLGREGGPG